MDFRFFSLTFGAKNCIILFCRHYVLKPRRLGLKTPLGVLRQGVT